MDDARFDELCRRVEALEREKSRWKVIGITSLTLLALVLCLGCPLSVGTALFRTRHVRELQAERDAAEQERRAAEAEKARHEAERRDQQAGQKAPGTEK